MQLILTIWLQWVLWYQLYFLAYISWQYVFRAASCQRDSSFSYYYLDLFFCCEYLTSSITVAFLCVLSPTAALFSLRGLHSMRSSAAGQRPGLQRKGEINNQLEEQKHSTKLSVTCRQSVEICLLDFLLFLFLTQHPYLIWGQVPPTPLSYFLQTSCY